MKTWRILVKNTHISGTANVVKSGDTQVLGFKFKYYQVRY